MYNCRFAQTIEAPWVHMRAIILGSIPSGLGTPDGYCLVEEGGYPRMRIDIYGQAMAFADAQIWRTWVVIGFADAVHFVSLATYQPYSYPLHAYFGYLYLTAEDLLVASASELLCFDAHGGLRWKTEDLGIDGVVVTRIAHDTVYGEGEWDPPDGWQSFILSLRSGCSIIK